MRWLPLLVLLGYAAPAAPPVTPPVIAAPPPELAVLVAGDASLRVFDDAVIGLRDRLATEGARITRLSADPAIGGTSLSGMLHAVAAMRPVPGQGCLVFATSHGAHDGTLVLGEDFLRPAALDRALSVGCGSAPTVVVISGCFSGNFARGPMQRPNRVILTAARPDRPSFGCGAGLKMTVFDACLLADMDRYGDWAAVFAGTKICVTAAERAMDAVPSEPQSFFGRDVRTLLVPVVRPLVPADARTLAGDPDFN